MKKGELYVEALKLCTLSELIDLMCLKATHEGAEVRVKVTYPRNARGGKKRMLAAELTRRGGK